MSHDIRTPINGIRGMVQIADRFPNDVKKQAECRAKIMWSSDFLLELVNDVLDMSKLESGEMQLEEVPFDLNELLHDVGTLLSTQAQARGITYTITMEDKREKHVIGSPLHLKLQPAAFKTDLSKHRRQRHQVWQSRRLCTCYVQHRFTNREHRSLPLYL